MTTSAPPRHLYRLDLLTMQPLSASAHPGVALRAPAPADAMALAELMQAAYVGTIDYHGETLDDARGEIAGYFQGADDYLPLLPFSRLAELDMQLAGACLVSRWPDYDCPIIAYIMTAADWKEHGIARQLLIAVLTLLRTDGYTEVRAVITQGNIASERLLGSAGFRRLAQTASS